MLQKQPWGGGTAATCRTWNNTRRLGGLTICGFQDLSLRQGARQRVLQKREMLTSTIERSYAHHTGLPSLCRLSGLPSWSLFFIAHRYSICSPPLPSFHPSKPPSNYLSWLLDGGQGNRKFDDEVDERHCSCRHYSTLFSFSWEMAVRYQVFGPSPFFYAQYSSDVPRDSPDDSDAYRWTKPVQLKRYQNPMPLFFVVPVWSPRFKGSRKHDCTLNTSLWYSQSENHFFSIRGIIGIFLEPSRVFQTTLRHIHFPENQTSKGSFFSTKRNIHYVNYDGSWKGRGGSIQANEWPSKFGPGNEEWESLWLSWTQDCHHRRSHHSWNCTDWLQLPRSIDEWYDYRQRNR